ncbi:MAG: SDR family NAD(P)-dependent oxidoreductase [Candidatus Micrarchaeota archaeon]|nr:SDR family NAD(P)-dependent oxidoreductase [Candidatus Micrarchaeota archaeon]
MTLAIVTGGNRGIGLAIARKLAENGIDIVIAARNRRLMADAKSCIEKLGVKCWAFSCDVTSKKEIANLVKEVSKLGPVDILVNNAGIGFLKNFNYNKNNEIDSMIDTNFRGLVYFTKAFLPVMLARKKGIIINIASICGKIGYRELAVYCGTKFAVIGFTESLANEVVKARQGDRREKKIPVRRIAVPNEA